MRATTKPGPIYVLSTHIDLQHRIATVLAREIDECARELRLREKSVSLHVARCYLIEATAQDLILNMAVIGKVQNIEQAALYLGQRAAYGIQTGQFTTGEEVHGKEATGDRVEDVLALRAQLVSEDSGLPEEVCEHELQKPVLVGPEKNPQEQGTTCGGT